MQNEGLIRKIAWSFYKTTNICFEDLYQEAWYIYVKALNKHDPKNGRMTTFAWWCITNHLRNYIKEEKKQTKHYVFFDDVNLEFIYTPTNFIESLTSDAIRVLEIIKQSPTPYLKPRKNRKRKSISRLRSRLIKNNWERERINAAFTDIRTALSV